MASTVATMISSAEGAGVAGDAGEALGGGVLEDGADHHGVDAVADVLAALDDAGAAGVEPVLGLEFGLVEGPGGVPWVHVVGGLEHDLDALRVVALDQRLVEAVEADEGADAAD